jgi:hypothetical protein
MITMTKTIMTIALIVMASITINAQSNTEFGVKGGTNITKLKNGDGKVNIGVVAGVFAEFKVSEKFSIRPEVLFSTRNIKVGSGKDNLGYINVPVLAKFYFLDKFSVEAGSQFGYLILKEDGSLNKTNYREIELGAVFGASYRITDHLEGGVRYNLGVRNLTKSGGDIKNSSLQFTLSYGF